MNDSGGKRKEEREGGRPLSSFLLPLFSLLFVLLDSAHAQRADLDRIRTDITRMRARLEEVRRQAQSAARELEEVELELNIRTRELDLAAAA